MTTERICPICEKNVFQLSGHPLPLVGNRTKAESIQVVIKAPSMDKMLRTRLLANVIMCRPCYDKYIGRDPDVVSKANAILKKDVCCCIDKILTPKEGFELIEWTIHKVKSAMIKTGKLVVMPFQRRKGGLGIMDLKKTEEPKDEQ